MPPISLRLLGGGVHDSHQSKLQQCNVPRRTVLAQCALRVGVGYQLFDQRIHHCFALADGVKNRPRWAHEGPQALVPSLEAHALLQVVHQGLPGIISFSTDPRSVDFRLQLRACGLVWMPPFAPVKCTRNLRLWLSWWAARCVRFKNPCVRRCEQGMIETD